MAAGFLTATSASITTGTKVVYLTGGVDCSFVSSGTAVYVDNHLMEGVSGTAADPIGNSRITLRTPWLGETLSAKTLVAFNTIEGLRDAIQGARQFSNIMATMTSSMGMILTSMDEKVTIEIDGVPVEITPYGYLSGKVTTLLAAAGGALDTLTALQADVATLTTTVNNIQGDLDAKIAVAAGHVSKAKDWATNPTDTEVEVGQYSALHWSAKSQGFSTESQGFRNTSQKWSEAAEGVEVEAGKFSSLHWSAKSLGYANNAESQKSLARKWAEEATDTEVITGKFSSLHWADKSKGFSLNAANSDLRSQKWSEAAEGVEVEAGKFSSLHWSLQSTKSSDLSKDWSMKAVDTEVITGGFSSLHWAEKSKGFSLESGQQKAVAEKWATNPLDVEIEAGKFSSFHWAEKAKGQADLAATYGANAWADGGNVDLSSGGFPNKPVVATYWRISVGGTVSGVLYKAGETLAYSKAADVFYRLEVLAGTAWGAVTGTLSNQVDLQDALNLKLDISSKATKAVAEAGVDNTKWMTPLQVNNAVQKLVPTASESVVGIVSLTNSHTEGTTDKATTGKALVDGLAANKEASDLALTAGIGTRALSTHNHSGEEITSGTVSAERLPTASLVSQGVTKLSNKTNGTSEVLAVTEKALSDATAEASGIVIDRVLGVISVVTTTLPLGDKVTTIEREGGYISKIVEKYNNVTSTTTITRDIGGNIIGVNKI